MLLTDQMLLDRKVVVVGGAASGIEKAVSHGCAEIGATVHCLDLDESAAKRSPRTSENPKEMLTEILSIYEHRTSVKLT